MKRFTLVTMAALAVCLTGCETTRNAQGPVLSGQICAFGYCLTPAVVATEPPPVVMQPAYVAPAQVYTPAPPVQPYYAPAPPALAVGPAVRTLEK